MTEKAINPKYKFIVVGAGFFGLTLAERIANELKENVLVLENREHIGGNAFTYFDEETGIEVHKYGTHIFHTSNEKVWRYINKFGKFNEYRHKVVTIHKGKTYFMPINLSTINNFFGKDMNPKEARSFLLEKTLNCDEGQSLESKATKQIGSELYDAFIKGYTQKQWQTDPSKLPSSIITRLPVRFDYNIDYFNDKYQGIPLEGYTSILEKMIHNPLITLQKNTDYFSIKKYINHEKTLTIYTGPIDRYFNFEYGQLGWRTLDLTIERFNEKDVLGNSVINYPDLDVPFTRKHEFRHLHPERQYPEDQTLVMTEVSRKSNPGDEPYYPINSSDDREILAKYRARSRNERNVLFGGRLGTYQYLDMHMAIASALSMFENEVIAWPKGGLIQ